MAITFGAQGAVAAGTTALTVAYPAGISATDLLVLAVANKYPTNGPATPSGWVLLEGAQASGGSGSAGADTGSVYATVFYRFADGTETGDLALTLTGANSSQAIMLRYTKSGTMSWSLAASGGSDNAAGTAWSVTCATNPGIAAGDVVLAVTAVNTDLYSFSSTALAATGLTAFGTITSRTSTGTTQGDDSRIRVTEHPITTGTATAAPVYTMTSDGTATDNPCGATVLLRLREMAPSSVPGLGVRIGVGL